jgi:hypothetical protein
MEIHNKIAVILIIIIVCLIVCIIINQYYPIISDVVLGGLIVVMLGIYKYNSYHKVKVCKTEGNKLICEIGGKGEYNSKSGGVDGIDNDKKTAINNIIDFIEVGSRYTPKDSDDENELNGLLQSMDASLVICKSTGTGREHNEDAGLISYASLDTINNKDDKYIFINADLESYNESFNTEEIKTRGIKIDDFELIGVNLNVGEHFIACVKYEDGWYKMDSIGASSKKVNDNYVINIINNYNKRLDGLDVIKSIEEQASYDNPTPSYRLYRNKNKTKLKQGPPRRLRQFDNICYIACSLQLMMATDLLDNNTKKPLLQRLKDAILDKKPNKEEIKSNIVELQRAYKTLEETRKKLEKTGVSVTREGIIILNSITNRISNFRKAVDSQLINNISVTEKNKLLKEYEDILTSLLNFYKNVDAREARKNSDDKINNKLEAEAKEKSEDAEEARKKAEKSKEAEKSEEARKVAEESEKARKEVVTELNKFILDLSPLDPKSDKGKKILQNFIDRIELLKNEIDDIDPEQISSEYTGIKSDLNLIVNKIEKTDEESRKEAKEKTKQEAQDDSSTKIVITEEQIDAQEETIEDDEIEDDESKDDKDFDDEIDNEDGIDVYSSYTSTNFTKKKVYNKPYGLGSSSFDDFYKKIVSSEV